MWSHNGKECRSFGGCLSADYIKRLGDPAGKNKNLDARTENMFVHSVNYTAVDLSCIQTKAENCWESKIYSPQRIIHEGVT
jgi:hypothetical protein